MSQQSCSACNDLREYAPEFVVNGTTGTVGDHLTADEGLSGADGHNDCDDLMDVNDCLIGNMMDALDGYEVCDWKDFMASFIGNLYETIKAMVYSQCGQWCSLNYLFNGHTFSIGEDTDGDAYAVAGKGVSFLLPHVGQPLTSDLMLWYVGGALVRGTGSYWFYDADFTDADSCGNFDNGTNYSVSQNRKGNSVWGTNTMPNGGELICEFRIKNSAFPQVRRWVDGFGQETGGGSYQVIAFVFRGGVYAYGQHGNCNNDGSPHATGNDAGHLVPDGWTYIQLRMTSCFSMTIPSSTHHNQYSPMFLMGLQLNQDNIEC